MKPNQKLALIVRELVIMPNNVNSPSYVINVGLQDITPVIAPIYLNHILFKIMEM